MINSRINTLWTDDRGWVFDARVRRALERENGAPWKARVGYVVWLGVLATELNAVVVSETINAAVPAVPSQGD